MIRLNFTEEWSVLGILLLKNRMCVQLCRDV